MGQRNEAGGRCRCRVRVSCAHAQVRGGTTRGVGGKSLLRFMGGRRERGVWGDTQAALLTGWMHSGREGIGCWGQE